MFRTAIDFLAKLLPSIPVYAHCDVPCGIYDPRPAQIAAATVKKMVQLIGELPKESTAVADRNKFVRCVLTKEEHAQKCKTELLILWTDYFKPEHLTIFPTLHDTFWKSAKLCSKNKQEVSLEAADELVAAVDEIAHMFEQSKKETK
ncbi:MAG: superoxide dismutase, Ni [bacterium]|nr:superoxide dismutase, Ni [bacterium]